MTGKRKRHTAAFKAQPLVHTGVGSKPVAVRLADVNNNGNLDLLVANSGTNTIGVFLGGLTSTGTQQFVLLQNVPVKALSPVALASIIGYSYAKRYTAFAHLFLGWALAISPSAAWIAKNDLTSDRMRSNGRVL